MAFRRRCPLSSRALLLAAVSAASIVALPAGKAWAQPPSPELMARLAVEAVQLDAMRLHANYLLEGKLERLDGDGKCDQVNELKGRVEADGREQHFVVIKYTEGGEDKTEEERKKQHDKEEAKKKKKDPHELKIPFLAAQQPRYVFDQVEVDKADASRVRVSFVPKEPDDDTIEGSVWVDTRTGRPYSAGFKVSKPGTFIDYVHVTLELGADTALGPAVSRLTLDGKGGVLFFRKHFRAVATFTDYRIVP